MTCYRTMCSVQCAERKMLELGVVINQGSMSNTNETGGFDDNVSSNRALPSMRYLQSPNLHGPASGEGVGRRGAESQHVGGMGTGVLSSFPALCVTPGQALSPSSQC